MTGPVLRRVGPEAAVEVLDVVRAAFSARPALDPPADALAETVETVADALTRDGGLVLELDGVVVAATLLRSEGDTLWLRRFGVRPDAQHHGLAARLVDTAARPDVAGDARVLAVLARPELPATVGFWRGQGFEEVGETPPYLELHRPLATSYDVPTGDDMRDLGRRLAAHLRPGDLVVLTGELGAGKTTLTQGLGTGLGVRGDVTSPTFVISRVHPSLGDGPDLVHVDAYRIGGLAELDDLDLDASFDEAVTVVEWGHGLAEGLADSWLEVTLQRAEAAPDGDLDPRTVAVRGFGPRWRGPVRL